MAHQTFNDITIENTVNTTDYLVGYRPDLSPYEINITLNNFASYINSNFQYTSAVNTNQLISSQPDYINMNGNNIINCKNSLKAWVTFNGYFNNPIAVVGNNDPYNKGYSVPQYTTSTTNPLVGGNPNGDTTVYVYTISARHVGVKAAFASTTYNQIFVTTSFLSGSYQILSFPTADSFTFQFVAKDTNTNFSSNYISWYSAPIMSSYNVSSIKRKGLGWYTINFSNGTFNDANFSIIGGSMSPTYATTSLAGTQAPATGYPYGWFNKTVDTSNNSTKGSGSVDVYYDTGGSQDSAMVFFGFFGN